MEEYTENLNITGPINILMKLWNVISEETDQAHTLILCNRKNI